MCARRGSCVPMPAATQNGSPTYSHVQVEQNLVQLLPHVLLPHALCSLPPNHWLGQQAEWNVHRDTGHGHQYAMVSQSAAPLGKFV
jgi:hypothetical protein